MRAADGALPALPLRSVPVHHRSMRVFGAALHPVAEFKRTIDKYEQGKEKARVDADKAAGKAPATPGAASAGAASARTPGETPRSPVVSTGSPRVTGSAPPKGPPPADAKRLPVKPTGGRTGNAVDDLVSSLQRSAVEGGSAVLSSMQKRREVRRVSMAIGLAGNNSMALAMAAAAAAAAADDDASDSAGAASAVSSAAPAAAASVVVFNPKPPSYPRKGKGNALAGLGAPGGGDAGPATGTSVASSIVKRKSVVAAMLAVDEATAAASSLAAGASAARGKRKSLAAMHAMQARRERPLSTRLAAAMGLSGGDDDAV